ncbi:hypothetical protein PSPTOT1_0440 [Pseudomonas syringae pv. tomato T1]|nr:hypothetical protein PSPTOT1_0440 [Pseudomonas syringae pv. tomato T1]
MTLTATRWFDSFQSPCVAFKDEASIKGLKWTGIKNVLIDRDKRTPFSVPAAIGALFESDAVQGLTRNPGVYTCVSRLCSDCSRAGELFVTYN